MRKSSGGISRRCFAPPGLLLSPVTQQGITLAEHMNHPAGYPRTRTAAVIRLLD